MARTSGTEIPVPSIRFAADLGPRPASMRMVPAGVRNAVLFPIDPEARMQSSKDIRVRLRLAIRS